jgi:hypothetical protein
MIGAHLPHHATHRAFGSRRLRRRSSFVAEHRRCGGNAPENGGGSEERGQLASHVFIFLVVGDLLNNPPSLIDASVALVLGIRSGRRFVAVRGLRAIILLAVIHAFHAHEHHHSARQDKKQRRQIGHCEPMLA